jgi:hypothetical protein
MTVSALARTGVRRRTLAVSAACLVGSTGCYHYAPLPVSDLEPAMAVRMELSGVAVDRLRRGPDSVARLVNGFNVTGTVARLNADSVVLSVPTSYMEANVRLKTQLHDLPLFRTEVQRVQWRRLDRARTTWVGVGIGVVGATAIALVINRGGRSSGGIPKPVDPVDSRMVPAR